MLSNEKISEFRERGVIVIESAYSEQALAPLRARLQGWIDESRHHAGPFGQMADGRPRFDVEPGHSAERPALRRVASPEEISDEFLALLEAGPMIDAAADLLGTNLRFHHAKLNSKLPGSGTRVKWHQDFTFDPHSNDDCLTVMLFVDAIDQTNGPPRVLPGSHRGPLYSLWHDGVFTGAVADEVAAASEAGAVDCLGPAGSLCLMHSRALHASAANTSTRAAHAARACQQGRLPPNNCTLPADMYL